jgi:outer membrane protein OmpA-like peptidoglycan-associated protein
MPDELEGGHDHPAVKRHPGSVLTELNEKDAESMPFPLSSAKTKTVEGKYYQAQYIYPLKATCAQVLQRYETAFKSAGLTTRSGEQRPSEVTWVAARWVSGEGRPRGKAGELYVVATCNDDPDYHAGDLFVVEAEAAEQNADTLADELTRSGQVALHGIDFVPGKAVLTPDSARTLEEIAKLLRSRPEWKLRIEGHTDNAGKPKDNLALSKQRAEAVKSWLVQKGIDAGRLTAEGYGDQKPLAPNDSEDGRARNRRVELAKL